MIEEQPGLMLSPPHPPVRRRLARGLIVSLIVFAAIATTAAILAMNRQEISDRFVAWQHPPTAVVAQYAARSTMTDPARVAFYASRPTVATGAGFDEFCANRTEEGGILGCYLPGEQRIYLYDVTDARLDGIEEVVASHEMLHAVWDRMSTAEREAIEPRLEAAAATRAGDAAFTATMAFYATTEPGERYNELHSIVGTEFDQLDPMLEAHYATYFTDRAAVVSLNRQSNAVFEGQQAAITVLLGQLDALRAEVETDSATYNGGYDTLNSDIDVFNARADRGDFSSQRQFDNERDALLGRQSDLDALFASIQEREVRYRDLVAQLDDLNAQVSELNRSINIPERNSGL